MKIYISYRSKITFFASKNVSSVITQAIEMISMGTEKEGISQFNFDYLRLHIIRKCYYFYTNHLFVKFVDYMDYNCYYYATILWI